jgi:transketolase
VRTAFIETLMDLAERDDRICLLTGDLGFTVLEKFAKAYPDRFINVGVAEANMIGLATGLACEGRIPYVYSIATFASMRGYEQIRNGPVLHHLPVRIIGIGGGFAYGHAGITHYALEDFSIMRAQPGLTVIAPADPPQTHSAIRSTFDLKGPIYFRIGKGGDAVVPGLEGRFSLDSVEKIGRGQELLLLTTGSLASEVVELSSSLGNCTVGIVATLNPSPAEALLNLIKNFKNVISIEEHYVHGGLGSLTAETIASSNHPVVFKPLAVQSIPSGVTGSRRYMCDLAGVGPAVLKDQIKSILRKG